MALSGSISGGGYDRGVHAIAPIIDRSVPGEGLGPKGVRPRAKKLPGVSPRNKVSALLVVTVFLGSFMVMLLSYSGPIAWEDFGGTITITGDDGFTEANGVMTGGDGSSGNPFIISGWQIDAGTGTGISISDTDKYFVIRDVRVWSSTTSEYAIYFNNANNGAVELSQIEDSQHGVYTVSSANIRLEENAFDDCTYVVSIMSSDYCSVLKNTMSAGSEAIVVSSSSNCAVVGNEVSLFNLAATFIEWSSEVLVSSNNVSDCSVTGIRIESSADCVVFNNTLWENDGYWAGGVLLWECSGTDVYHNSFFGNTGSEGGQAYQYGGSGNRWNIDYMWNSPSPSGGNYWSDYTGADSHSGATTPQTSGPSDGIGDTAYTFSESAQDNYPLMEPPGGGGTVIPEFSTVVVPVIFVMAIFLLARRRRSK